MHRGSAEPSLTEIHKKIGQTSECTKRKINKYFQVHASSLKPTKNVYDENETKSKKITGALKYFEWKEGVYKACAENS